MDHKEAALLILRSLEAVSAEREAPLTRGRFSRLALRVLLGRRYRIDVGALNEYLTPAGWVLMYDGKTYLGALKLSVIEDWPRVRTATLDTELAEIDDGEFDFDRLSYLLDKEFWRTGKLNKALPGRVKGRKR